MTNRSVTAAAETASRSGSGYSARVAIDLDIESGAIRLATGAGNFAWSGKTFRGVGGLGNVSTTEEGVEIKSRSLECSISAPMDAGANVSVALGENYRNRRGTLYLMFFDANDALVNDPIVLFRGRMDNMTIKYGQKFTIGVRIESVLADWDRPRERRFTNEHQQDRFPGDRGLEFVPQMAELELNWGIPGQKSGPPPPPGDK